MRSISHLRHHSQTGVLHYRRVVPPELRPIIGKATISGTLGSKTLDHAALIRWVEIDRHAEQRLANARQKLAGQPLLDDRPEGDTPAFIDVRRCIAAFEDWKQLEIGRESVRLYGLYGHGDENGLAAFRQEQISARNALTNTDYQTAVAGFEVR